MKPTYSQSMVCIGRVVRQDHGYNRRLTGKHGHRGNILKSDTLAIGKDSNGIRVRSSCLEFRKGEERIHEVDGATVERILTTPERNRS